MSLFRNNTKTDRLDERIQSGVPRLDDILNGGFLRYGLYAIFGPPGGGKTILGNQICFNCVREDGRKAVYLTLLTESHTKMLSHLRQLSFFNEDSVGTGVTYVSGYQAAKEQGVKGLVTLIRDIMIKNKPDLFVMDGVESIEQFSTRQDYKEFLHELQAVVAMGRCTGLLLSTCSGAEVRRAENTLVDGVIELSDHLIGPRAVRELTVHKFRGSDYLRGKHEVEITSDGIQIHPRTEIQFDKPPQNATESRQRMGFGIGKLDDMMGGGPLSGSSLALVGAPGTGKTTLGLNFLVEGAKNGQKGIYFGFYEPPPRLMEKADSMGLPLEKYVKSGAIELLWQPPLEHFMDSLAEQLLEKIRGDAQKRRRLFIDGVEGFRAAAVYDERLPRFLSALTNQLRMSDVTTVFSEELPLFQPELKLPNPELANVVESVVLLRYVEVRSQLYRLISIMKMRESAYDTSIREFRIDKQGIEVAGSFNSAEAILTGHARQSGASQPGSGS